MILNNVTKWEKVYSELIKTEHKFEEKYIPIEPRYYEKNCIELLVELGEFINETKCFKFWTTKNPNPEKVLEELVDCLTMILLFSYNLHLEITDIIDAKHHESSDVLKVINYIYEQSTKLMYQKQAEIIKEIFVNLIYLSKLLDLSQDDILDAFNTKLKVVENRLNSEY
ncbi:MAG: dUTP diphosphatase [Bacilli bacterium]|nr:dUTP diphosphatase [Bacilli bacterium]